MLDKEKTRVAGFPAFFVSPSRPRGADKAKRRDATEGQEGETGKMRFALIRDCVQAKGLRAASSGICPLGLIRGGISHVSSEFQLLFSHQNQGTRPPHQNHPGARILPCTPLIQYTKSAPKTLFIYYTNIISH